MVLKRLWLVGLCLGALPVLAAVAQAAEWTGTVVDMRTNKPLAGVLVYSSRPGRADAHEGYSVKTGADGRFRIPLPEGFVKWMDANRVPYVLDANVDWKVGAFRTYVVRPTPEEVLVKLLPSHAYIKGQAVSAETGAPLPDIGVALFRPGAVVESAVTDANGNFSFRPVPAFLGGTTVYDIRPPGLHTDQSYRVEEKYRSYAVGPYGKGSAQFVDITPSRKGEQFEPSLPLVSSVDDSIHTYVVLRLPKKGTVVADPSKHIAAEIRGLPPGTTTTPGATAPGSTTPVTTTTPGLTTPTSSAGEPASVARITLQAAKRKAKAGETVTVPVWLLKGAGLIDLNFNLEYDASVVQAMGNVVKGNLLEGADFEANTAKPGVVQFGLVPKTGGIGSADGTLAQVAFRAVGQAGSRTTLRLVPRKASVAGGAPANPATIDGEIQIVDEAGFVPGDVNGDGRVGMDDVLMALKISVELLPHNARADIDKDGQVTAADARLIRDMVLGIKG